MEVAVLSDGLSLQQVIIGVAVFALVFVIYAWNIRKELK